MRIVILPVLALAICSQPEATATPTADQVVNYCDIVADGDCQPPPWDSGSCETVRGVTTCCTQQECWNAEPLTFCCTPSGICVLTAMLGACDPDDIIAICTWGMSNPDGTITCFDE